MLDSWNVALWPHSNCIYHWLFIWLFCSDCCVTHPISPWSYRSLLLALKFDCHSCPSTIQQLQKRQIQVSPQQYLIYSTAYLASRLVEWYQYFIQIAKIVGDSFLSSRKLIMVIQQDPYLNDIERILHFSSMILFCFTHSIFCYSFDWYSSYFLFLICCFIGSLDHSYFS